MKSILYFTLLFVVLGSLNLFAVEQSEEKKIDANESAGSVRENAGIGRNLKQDLPKNMFQGNELESSKSDSVNVDKLNIEGAQDAKTEGAANKKKLQHNENKVSEVEKAIDEGEKIDKDLLDLGNNSPEESTDKFTLNLPNVTGKEMSKNVKTEPLPSDADLNKDIANPQKSLQVDKKINVEKDKILENGMSQLLEEKEGEVKDQTGEEEVKESAEDLDRENQVKPITKNDEGSEQEEKKNLQRWTELTREPIKEWYNKNVQSKSIYKRQYDNLNEHLPTGIFFDDYSKQLFYCVKKNNLFCLRGITDKLEKIGLTTKEVLEFRNKLGDTLLIYAVKQGKINVVRFLLLQGANPKVVNNSLQSPIDIAIERKRADIINAIAEMTSHFLEHKKIYNKEDLEMYDWAIKTKESNESQCSKIE